MTTVNSVCRDCGSGKLEKFLDLGSQAPANAFVRPEEVDGPEASYPLEAYICTDCHLAQLIHVVDKAELFRNYVYFSSGMPKVSPHWEAYAKDVMQRFLTDGDFVVEVGSNDGILLKFFKDSGYTVLGVDPAENIAKVAEERGVPTMATFFTNEVAKEIVERHAHADAILANNVFAHIDNHQDFCEAAKTLLSDKGVLVIEAPYLIDMFENLAYDTIYHEHLSFLSVEPLVRLFKSHGLELFEVQVVEAQGNSLRLFVGHEGAHPVTPSVAELLKKEKALGLDTIAAFEELANRVKASTEKLVALLTELRREGKTIYGYGAPAKGNTLLNYAKIGPELVSKVLEDLPSKQGLLTPGMHIPVVTREYTRENPPDYYLMLAWNYKKPILEREAEYRANGGKFIIPIGDDIEVI